MQDKSRIKELCELSANAQALVENMQAQINRIDQQIKEQFPEFAELKQSLKDAQLHYAELANELKMQAIIDNDPLTSKVTRGVLVLQQKRLVTHFDEKKAIDWAVANNRLNLVKMSANKTSFLGALDNGAELNEDIIKAEVVTLASLNEENLRQFANIPTPANPESSDPLTVEELPF